MSKRKGRECDRIYDEEPVFYADAEPEPATIMLAPPAPPAPTKGLGQWSFDLRTKKRKYMSLGGRVFTGNDAMRQFREDQASEDHPAKSARGELVQLMRFSEMFAFLK